MIKFTIAILAAGANAVEFVDCEWIWEPCSNFYWRNDCWDSGVGDGWWYVEAQSDQ